MPDTPPRLHHDLPSVSVIILNYNSQEHLQHNLHSVLNLHYPAPRLEVILADNGSTDGSLEWVAAAYPQVRIERNNANLGFAAGNTAGARAARGEWLAFLNPDTRVAPDWLATLMEAALRDPEVVCVASKMLSWDGRAIDFADAAINFMGWGCQPGYGSSRLEDFSHDKEILFACGGAMLIRRDVYLDAGGFDPGFFAYYEDVDLGWRLWLMGHKVAFASRAVAYHRHHGSWSGVNDAKRWTLAERNTLFTAVKNYDDEHLARILPAALLLLAERAYLDARPDPAWRGLARSPLAEKVSHDTPAAAGGAVYGVQYYLQQGLALLRRGAYQELVRRAGDEAGRRWQRMRRPEPGPVAQSRLPANGHFTVPSRTLSRLFACREVLRAWPVLMEKRQAVQRRRRRTDRQIFPLFQWELTSNFGDEDFIRAMQLTIARFGLLQVFRGDDPQTDVNGPVIELGRQAALGLLQVLDKAAAISGAEESAWRVGTPAPMDEVSMRESSLALVAELHRILWALPDAPLPEVLCWTAEHCRQLLSEAPADG